MILLTIFLVLLIAGLGIFWYKVRKAPYLPDDL